MVSAVFQRLFSLRLSSCVILKSCLRSIQTKLKGTADRRNCIKMNIFLRKIEKGVCKWILTSEHNNTTVGKIILLQLLGYMAVISRQKSHKIDQFFVKIYIAIEKHISILTLTPFWLATNNILDVVPMKLYSWKLVLLNGFWLYSVITIRL